MTLRKTLGRRYQSRLSAHGRKYLLTDTCASPRAYTPPDGVVVLVLASEFTLTMLGKCVGQHVLSVAGRAGGVGELVVLSLLFKHRKTRQDEKSQDMTRQDRSVGSRSTVFKSFQVVFGASELITDFFT